MEFFAPYLEIITTVLNLISIVILIWGIVLCMKDFLGSQLKRATDWDQKLVKITKAKNKLGWYILLSLEILIVADIIDSIVKPTFEDIIRLGAIVAIRTVISHFLTKEISEANSMELKGEHHDKQ